MFGRIHLITYILDGRFISVRHYSGNDFITIFLSLLQSIQRRVMASCFHISFLFPVALFIHLYSFGVKKPGFGEICHERCLPSLYSNGTKWNPSFVVLKSILKTKQQCCENRPYCHREGIMQELFYFYNTAQKEPP